MQATSQSCAPAVVVRLFCTASGICVGMEESGFDGLAIEKDKTNWQSYKKSFPHPSVLRVGITKLTRNQIRTLVGQHYQARSRYLVCKDYPLFPDWFEFRSAKLRNIAARKCRAAVTCTNGRRSSYGSY